MPHYKNFAQCVEQLLKEHHLTVSRFGAQIGARSALRRALSNDLSSARRASLCEKPVSYTHLDVYKRQSHRMPQESTGSDTIVVL